MTATDDSGRSPRSSRARAQRNFLLTAVIAFLAGVVGAALGATIIANRQVPETVGMHAIVHDGLELSAEQERALDAVEDRFAVRRAALDARLSHANHELSAALRGNPTYSPDVRQAVDAFQSVMGELQVATVLHVYEMRAILTDEQAAVFDERVAEALTGEHREE